MRASKILTLVSAADAAYGHALAAMLWTARHHLSRDVFLDVRVIDGGLAPGDKAALENAMARAGGTFRLTMVPAPQMDDLAQGLAKHPLVYARLYIPSLFPDVDRALFLDSDMLVRRDLSGLLRQPFNGALAAAVRDTGNPTLGGPLEQLPLSEFGLGAEAPYFNVGMLWMDVAAWRRERVGERALALSRARKHDLVYADQSVLNLLLHSRWIELDESWNRQVWIDERRWQITPPGPSTLHFTALKPWDFPLNGAVGVTRYFARCLRRSGWTRHRRPVPKYRAPRRDGVVQRIAELRRWMVERRLQLRYGKSDGRFVEASWVRGMQ